MRAISDATGRRRAWRFDRRGRLGPLAALCAYVLLLAASPAGQGVVLGLHLALSHHGGASADHPHHHDPPEAVHDPDHRDDDHDHDHPEEDHDHDPDARAPGHPEDGAPIGMDTPHSHGGVMHTHHQDTDDEAPAQVSVVSEFYVAPTPVALAPAIDRRAPEPARVAGPREPAPSAVEPPPPRS